MNLLRNLLSDPKIRNALVGLVLAVAGYVVNIIAGGPVPMP